MRLARTGCSGATEASARHRRPVAAALLLALLGTATAGCGGEESSSAAESHELTVAAAASLTEGFEAYAEHTPLEERFSFAGSDQLAAQIRQGAAPDVFAAASTRLPDALHDGGFVGRPRVFATGELVLAVPAGSGIDSVEDLTASGVDLVLGTEEVPFGAYARRALARLPAGDRDAILANLRSEEPDAKAAVGKLIQGAAEAAFVYASDVAAADGRLEAVPLPRRLRPDVEYAVAVARDAENPEAARAFVDGLTSGAGARALEKVGLEPAGNER